MTKLELTSSWPTVVRMASEGASLREIAEEVGATPGAINTALKRNGIEKAPAPPGPRVRRGASPPPPKGEKVPKVKGERPARLKAAKAPKTKTFPEVLAEVIEGEFLFIGYDVSTPEQAAISLRVIFRSLGLMPKNDNLSNDDDCSEDTDSDFTPSVHVDTDSSGEDDNGDCDGSIDTDDVVPSVSGDFDGLNVVGLPVVTFGADSQPSVVGEVISQHVNEDGGLSVQIAVDPNEVTLRGDVIESPDDWGTPPSFTIPSDEELASMNRDDLRKLAANPGLKSWKYLKGYSRMSADDLRKALSQVRNDSV